MRANKLSDERVEVKRRVRMTREMQRELEMAERLERVGCPPYLNLCSAIVACAHIFIFSAAAPRTVRRFPLLQSAHLFSLTVLSLYFFSFSCNQPECLNLFKLLSRARF
jgi:hypothetical protein